MNKPTVIPLGSNTSIPADRVSVVDDVSKRSPSARIQSQLADSGVPQLQKIANLMDSAFRIPGTNLSLGLDAILGLVPGLGDTVTTIISIYIMQEAQRIGVPRVTMARMAMNTGVDYIVGAIPFVGDAFDVVWKANIKNVELLRRHIEAHPAEAKKQQKSDWLFLAGLSAALIVMLVGSITIAWTIVSLLVTALRG